MGDDPVICFCNNVSRGQIFEAIEKGARDLKQIYDRCGAGVGPCGGSCRENLRALLAGAQKSADPGTGWDPPLAFTEGISLFNRRYYWETHEVLEKLWMDENGPDRLLYQGIIQAAAALYHVLNANPKGVIRLAEEAQKKLSQFLPAYHSLPLQGLVEALGSYAAQAREVLGGMRAGFDYDQLPMLALGGELAFPDRPAGKA